MAHVFDHLDPELLSHADSYKWTRYPKGVLPLWVADMDYPVAPGILRALHDRLERGIGYHQLQGDPVLLDLIAEQQASRGVHHLTHERMWLLPGVVPGLYASVLNLTSAGDEVLTHTPIYPPFLEAISQQGRVVRHAPLTMQDRSWHIDWEAMENAVTPASRLFLLCNPHNPTGRVWTRPELERLADFVLRHRLWVVSDELHADLTLDGHFTPLASISDEIAQRTVTLTGPAKAYNTAGLGIGVALSANPQLIDRLRRSSGITGHPNAMAVEMWRAAITTAGPWLDDVLNYLRANREHLTTVLREHLPEVRFEPPQATYLAWLDFRAFSWAGDAQQFMLDRARVGLNDGPTFGPGFEGFLRLNFATSRVLLNQALEQMIQAVRDQAREE